jgi:hypothetical protein
MTTTIGPIEVGEIKAVTFDFTSEAAANAVLTSPSVTCAVVDGVDASPSNVLQGTPLVTGLTVTQLVKPGVVGVNYKLHCYVSETSGARHHISAKMKVVPA